MGPADDCCPAGPEASPEPGCPSSDARRADSRRSRRRKRNRRHDETQCRTTFSLAFSLRVHEVQVCPGPAALCERLDPAKLCLGLRSLGVEHARQLTARPLRRPRVRPSGDLGRAAEGSAR